MANRNEAFSVLLLTIILCSLTTSLAQDVSVTIDLDRNLPGASASVLPGILDEVNNFYFFATGSDAKYSDFSFVDSSNLPGYAATLIPIVTSNGVLLRLSINPLMAGLVDNGLLLEIAANGKVALLFEIHEIQDVALLSCLNDAVLLKVPADRNETHLSVWGKPDVAECNFQILLDDSLTISIPMSTCGVAYDVEFLLRFTQMTAFEGLDDDLNARLTCKRMTDTFILTNNDVLSKYNEVTANNNMTFEQDLQVIMYLHERDDPSSVITTQGIEVKTDVSLKIEMDSLYANDFDVVPLVCTANDILILGKPDQQLDSLDQNTPAEQLSDVACALSPFANFTKTAVGQYRADFKMFRTVRLRVSDTSVNFACLMYVCKTGTCPVLPCIQ